MSGSSERLLLDTNAIIGLLRGHAGLLERTATAEWIGASVISYIEFLAFPGISSDDCAAFRRFFSRIDVIDLAYSNAALIELAITLRQRHRLKLPDAVIAATAIISRATLATSDQQLPALGRQLSELTVSAF